MRLSCRHVTSRFTPRNLWRCSGVLRSRRSPGHRGGDRASTPRARPARELAGPRPNASSGVHLEWRRTGVAGGRAARSQRKRMSAPRVAIVCDWLSVYAGAERVLEQMLSVYPDAEVFGLFE